MRRRLPTTPSVLILTALTLAACSGAGGSSSSLIAPANPPLQGSTGIERMLHLSSTKGAAHTGVDAVRMPYVDPLSGEMRDRQLLVSSCCNGIYAALVDDDWHLIEDAFWPVTGSFVPWSDLKVVRRKDAHGDERVCIYQASRGSNLLQIIDVTDFPEVKTAAVPVDLGVSVLVRGVHTLQVHEGRGVLVLNGIDIGPEVPPAPLTFGSAPAAFFDIDTDPLAPRLLSVFPGESPGDQVMFDSQFLRIGDRDLWAPTINQPATGLSYFAFYEFNDPTAMQHPHRIAYFGNPTSGTAHNVVQMLPRPDGTPLLAAGYEAWAFLAGEQDVVSKAAVLDASALLNNAQPQHLTFLHSAENHKDAVHNPCSRLAEIKTHTYDTVPLAHFTGGYYLYEYDSAQPRVLAHSPVSQITPSGRFGRHHDRMTVPVWMAAYNGAWDMVATPIGDLVSSTDRESSFLVEPTYGFGRQYGSYIPQDDGTVPRIHLAGRVPEVGRELRLKVEGLLPGGRVELTISKRLRTTPAFTPAYGALWYDPSSLLHVASADVTGTTAEFVLPILPEWTNQLVVTATERVSGNSSGLLKTPALVFRVRPGNTPN